MEIENVGKQPFFANITDIALVAICILNRKYSCTTMVYVLGLIQMGSSDIFRLPEH